MSYINSLKIKQTIDINDVSIENKRLSIFWLFKSF